jgi:uncharacterized phiE125 gp8 family phage protein
VAVSYADDAGVEHPLDTGIFRMSHGGDEPARLMLRGPFLTVLPREFDALTLDYRAGYGDRGIDVPDPLRQAVMVTVASMYEDREGATVPAGTPQGEAPLPPLARQLMAGYRVILL